MADVLKKKPAFAPVGDVLNQHLGQWGLAERINLKRMQQLWPGVVGDKIAGFTHIVGLSGTRLRVKLDRVDWLTALQPLTREIIAGLNQGLRKQVVEEIVFEVELQAKGVRRKAKPKP